MLLLAWSCEILYAPPCQFTLQQLIIDVDAGHVYQAIDALPSSAHPMTQFTTGVMALQVSNSSYDPFICSIISVFWNTKSHFLTNHSTTLNWNVGFLFRKYWYIIKQVKKNVKIIFILLEPQKGNNLKILYVNSISGWEWISKGLRQRNAKIKVCRGFLCCKPAT